MMSLAIVACAVVAALLAWLRTHDFRGAIALMLDLWVAGGLLRLTQDATWRAIAGAAAVIGVRKLVVHGLTSRPAKT